MRTFPTYTLPSEPNKGPKDALDAARTAFRAGQYGEALERYEWFFDHALVDDPHSNYGVRLSYCLSEWSRLGSKYPPAHKRLVDRRDEALQLFVSARDPERFHDFMAICRALDEESRLPVETFADLHNRDRLLAASAVSFIWHQIVDAGLWDVAAAYVTDYKADYEEAIEKFEQSMKVCDENPDFGGDEFADRIRGWCVADLRDLWLVLMHSDRSSEAEVIRQLALGDSRLAKHPAVAERAFPSAARPG
ncbi:hypothetical protein BWI17_18220 [Betaproteobacteria bacterium GR16-43]|nr:hypothetical protein BWI17_18220 [Betaproteobacteria bacterium GR16-43]